MELSPFRFSATSPAAIALYTTDAKDTGLPRGVRWNGEVILCADLIIRYRQGAEGTLAQPNTEDIADASESALFECLNNPALQWPPGVRFTRESAATRGGVWELADGFQQVICVSMKFGADDV